MIKEIFKREQMKKPRVLVVEDDLDIREFITLGLQNDFEIIEAGNGKNGLEKVLDLLPDLVVSDIMMPGMNGVDLCREIKSRQETARIPVILLTAKTAVEDQMEGLTSGADDYVTKPFNLILLKARIENLLTVRRQLVEQIRHERMSAEQTLIPENDGDRGFLEKVQKVLSKNYTVPDFDDEKFAHEMGMSLRSLQRKLKPASDKSPLAFIKEYRMKRAAELLATSSHNITEIGFLVGIEEPTSFSRMFKKHFDMSPSDYRRTYSSSE